MASSWARLFGSDECGGYRRRASLYRCLDDELRDRTRFFAAASVICDVLAALSWSVTRVLLSLEARAFLSTLSGDLERLNVRIACAIRAGRLAVGGLDGRIVAIEQAYVQRQLVRLRARASGPLDDFNRLLNAEPCRRALALSCSGHLFAVALLQTRRDLARSIDFSRRSDREAIGNGIISAVRATDHAAERGERPRGPVTLRMASVSEPAAAS